MLQGHIWVEFLEKMALEAEKQVLGQVAATTARNVATKEATIEAGKLTVRGIHSRRPGEIAGKIAGTDMVVGPVGVEVTQHSARMLKDGTLYLQRSVGAAMKGFPRELWKLTDEGA